MFLLAIDTSGKQGSIALARAVERSDDDADIEVIETVPLIGGTFSAQLIPQISQLLSSHKINKQGIGAFAVTSGPGSFTGLRVGLAAVKALAEVLEKPVAPVSLLELCVFLSGVRGKVISVLDAGRGDVYVGSYEVPAETGTMPQETLLTMAEFVAQAKDIDVVSPDAALAESASAAGLSVSRIAPITAAEVARLGWHKIRRGETVTPDQLEANYIRRTDAEMLQKIGS
jgi:tRNA threonylcarbamoyladenosine biosynthesis protein TsaB